MVALCDTFWRNAYLIVTMKINILTGLSDKRETEAINWREVYDRLLPKIFHYFCYKTGDTDTSEELTAITLEKAWAGRNGFKTDQGQFDDWVYGIARRTAVDHFRSGKSETDLDVILHQAAGDRLEDDIQKKLMFERICQLIRQFPEREQELVALKYGAEMTNREIARVTGLSESNVGTILHRLVMQLRELLEEES